MSAWVAAIWLGSNTVLDLVFLLGGLATGGIVVHHYWHTSPRKILLYRDAMVMVYVRPGTRIIPYSLIGDAEVVEGVSSRQVHLRMRNGRVAFSIRNPRGFCDTLEGLLERYRNGQTGGAQGRNAP